MRTAFRAIEVHTSRIAKQFKWKKTEKESAFYDATIFYTFEHAKKDCDKFYRARKQKLKCNTH